MRRTPEVMMAVTSHKISDSLRKARRRKAAVKKTKKKKGPTGNAATEREKKKKGVDLLDLWKGRFWSEYFSLVLILHKNPFLSIV